MHIRVENYFDHFDTIACGHFVSPCVSDDDNMLIILDVYSMDEEVPTYVSLTKQVFNTTTCESESFISSYSMNMELVAEGVENKEQAEKLENMGCDFFQGYLYSRPICKEDFYMKISEQQIEK